jgi:hypothetical protein
VLLLILVAPLVAPLTVALTMVGRAAVTGTPGAIDASPAAIVFFVLIVAAYAAPLIYAGMLLVLWPASVALRRLGLFRAGTVVAIAAVGGGVAFPIYLRALEPRGTWDFVPGTGVIAGALTGWLWWGFLRRPGRAEA